MTLIPRRQRLGDPVASWRYDKRSLASGASRLTIRTYSKQTLASGPLWLRSARQRARRVACERVRARPLPRTMPDPGPYHTGPLRCASRARASFLVTMNHIYPMHGRLDARAPASVAPHRLLAWGDYLMFPF